MEIEEINKVLGDFMLDSDKETVVTCVVNGYQQVSYLWRTSATFSIDYDDSVVFVAAKVLSIQDSNFFPDEETRNFFEEASVKVCSSELTEIFLDLQLFDLTRQSEHPYIPMLEKFLEFNELDKVFETFQVRLSENGIKDPVELFQMRKTGNGMVYYELELF